MLQRLIKTVCLCHTNTEPFTKCHYIQIYNIYVFNNFREMDRQGRYTHGQWPIKNDVILLEEPAVPENTKTKCDSCVWRSRKNTSTKTMHVIAKKIYVIHTTDRKSRNRLNENLEVIVQKKNSPHLKMSGATVQNSSYILVQW